MRWHADAIYDVNLELHFIRAEGLAVFAMSDCTYYLQEEVTYKNVKVLVLRKE